MFMVFVEFEVNPFYSFMFFAMVWWLCLTISLIGMVFTCTLHFLLCVITHFQKNGSTPELVNEARDSLLAANVLSPGESRFTKLMDSLNEFASSND